MADGWVDVPQADAQSHLVMTPNGPPPVAPSDGWVDVPAGTTMALDTSTPEGRSEALVHSGVVPKPEQTWRDNISVLGRNALTGIGAGLGGVAGFASPLPGGLAAGALLGGGIGKSLGNMAFGPAPQENPTVNPAQGQGAYANAKELMSNIPSSAVKTANSAMGSMSDLSTAAVTPGGGAQVAQGIGQSIKNLGSQNEWVTNPVGNAATLGSIAAPTAELAGIVGKGADALLSKLPVQPESVARSALKPYNGDIAAKQRATANGIQTFLHDDNATPNMSTFLDKNVDEMNQINGRQNALIGAKGDSRVSIAPVEDALKSTVNDAAETPGTSTATKGAAQQVLDDIKNHPSYDPVTNSIPVSMVQTMKQNIWQYLKSKNAFSKDANPALNDAMWSAADGMRNIVNDVIPEMSDENARYGELANVNQLLTKAIARNANNNIVPLRSLIMIAKGDVGGFARSVMAYTLDHPTFKSYIAQRLAQAKGRPVSPAEVTQAVADIQTKTENSDYNPEVLPGRQSSAMDEIPGGNGQPGLEEGGIPPASALNPPAQPYQRRPLNLPVGKKTFYDQTIGATIPVQQKTTAAQSLSHRGKIPK